MVEKYGEQGYHPDLSPFRPLPEQELVEVAAPVTPADVEEAEQVEVVAEATTELEEILDVVEEDDTVIPEKERYFEVAKDYGVLGEEE